MDKIATGVPGLDKILKGGLRKGTFTLISGVPGTGKTILGLQFLVEGVKRGERGLFICSEEPQEDVKTYAKNLKIDLDEFEKLKKLFFVQQQISDRKIVSLSTPIDMIKKEKIKRVFLDSLTMFKYMHMAGTMDFRKELYNFISIMKETGVTLLITAERDRTSLDMTKYEDHDFLFEGLIILTKIRKGASYERCITVQKMRGQDHSMDIYPFTIGEGGITIHVDQPPFSLIEQDVTKTKNSR